MNLLADEGVERQIVERLRQDGHTVIYIAEIEPGISDEVALSRSNINHALLITLDKDFGELAFRQGLVYSGVVLMRLAGLAPMTKATIVAASVHEFGDEMADGFSAITPGNVRIRKRKPKRSNGNRL